jgi:anti-sigma-K factor RskA
MPPDSKADLAHPEAADWVLGTMGPAQAADFSRHLTDCPHCRAAVAEFGDLGQLLQHLPPAAEPPPGLEARTIASVLAASAKYPTPTADRDPDPEDQAATRLQPRPQITPLAEDDARIQPRPQIPRSAEDEARPKVTRLPVWRRYQGRLSVVAAAAAAIIAAAIVIPLSLGGGGGAVVTSLAATAAAGKLGDGAATGQATAQPEGPSWSFTMTVHGLKVLPGYEVYECWYAAKTSTDAHLQLVSGGTFIVDASGSATVTMTTGIDPRDFPIMEITRQSPGSGARQGKVILISRAA